MISNMEKAGLREAYKQALKLSDTFRIRVLAVMQNYGSSEEVIDLEDMIRQTLILHKELDEIERGQ